MIVWPNEKLGLTWVPALAAREIVFWYSLGPANELKFFANELLPVNSSTPTESSMPPVTSQNRIERKRIIQRQPARWMRQATTIIAEPSPNSHHRWVEIFVPKLIRLWWWPIVPITTKDGPSALVTNAIPKNAFESRPAIVMQNDETKPSRGPSTRLTIM
jgi:hypothetical protein